VGQVAEYCIKSYNDVVCCRVWQSVGVCFSVLHCVSVWCGVFQCVAVSCKFSEITNNHTQKKTNTHDTTSQAWLCVFFVLCVSEFVFDVCLYTSGCVVCVCLHVCVCVLYSVSVCACLFV